MSHPAQRRALDRRPDTSGRVRADQANVAEPSPGEWWRVRADQLHAMCVHWRGSPLWRAMLRRRRSPQAQGLGPQSGNSLKAMSQENLEN